VAVSGRRWRWFEVEHGIVPARRCSHFFLLRFLPALSLSLSLSLGLQSSTDYSVAPVFRLMARKKRGASSSDPSNKYQGAEVGARGWTEVEHVEASISPRDFYTRFVKARKPGAC